LSILSIITITGKPISIVKDAAALRGLLYKARQPSTPGDSAKDVLDGK